MDRYKKRRKLNNGDYVRQQKRYCQQTDERVYEDWLADPDTRRLIQSELLDRGKRIPCLSTFVKYKPNYVRHGGGPLSQMVCDTCTEFGFVYVALLKQLSTLCRCTRTTCRGYHAPMGPKCTCASCAGCLIKACILNDFPFDFLFKMIDVFG